MHLTSYTSYLLDFFRNFICLLKLPFLASFLENFSTVCSHTLSKFFKKSTQKLQIFSSKASFERSLFFISAVAINIFLTGCYLLEDPLCLQETAFAPEKFWQPTFDYTPSCCTEQPCEEQIIAFLQSPTLVVADLIDIALQNNPTTQKTWAVARGAAFNVKLAQSALYPTIEWQEQFNYTNTRYDDDPLAFIAVINTQAQTAIEDLEPVGEANQEPQQVNNVGQCGDGDFDGVGTSTWMSTNLSASYLLLDFGGRQASIEAAKQALYQSNWTHNRQIQEVIFSVLQAYYTYEGLRYLLEQRQIDIKDANTNVQAAQEQFNAGAKTKLDVLQAETDLINIQLSVIEIEGQKEIAFSQLVNAIGLSAPVSFPVPKIPTNIQLEHITAHVDELVALAKERRPDLAAANAEHARTKANVIATRSAGLPTISLNLDWQQYHYLQQQQFNNRVLTGVVSLNVPLFNGFFYYNQTRQAQELVREACANLRLVEVNTAFDVALAYSDYQTAVESFTYTEKYLTVSQETYQAALMSYQEGIGTILDLLAAQRTLANARAQRIQSLTHWAIALARISFATGVLN